MTIENAVYFEPTMIEHGYSSDVHSEIAYLKGLLAQSDRGELALSDAEYSSMSSLV